MTRFLIKVLLYYFVPKISFKHIPNNCIIMIPGDTGGGLHHQKDRDGQQKGGETANG